MGNPQSLVLVTVDCLRVDHVGFMGYRLPTTPFLDSVAPEGFVFPGAIVAGAPTYYSFPAIFASRYPLGLGRDLLGVAPGEPTLATALRDAGYATAAFIAGNPFLTSHFGYEQGFDTFKDFLSDELCTIPDEIKPSTARNWSARLNRRLETLARHLGPVQRLYNEIYFEYCQRWATAAPQSLAALRRFPSADEVVTEAMNWLATVGSERFFLWIHLMDPHAPYYPTDRALAMMGNSAVAPFRARYINDSWARSDLSIEALGRYRADIISLYDAGVRWVDEQLARLVAHLRQSNQWESCAFTVTADHGEEFLDHGGRYHPPTGLAEEVIHVPLFLRVPGVQGRPVSNSVFSHLDLAPTLLDVLSVDPPKTFHGTSRWKQIQQGDSWDGSAVTECVQGCTNPFNIRNRIGPRVLAIRDTRYKLLVHFDPFSEDLYDLEKDPKETLALALTVEKRVRRRLLDRAWAHLHSSISEREPERQICTRLRDLRIEWEQPADRSRAC
jgi:arylsulfatase A-like enzyme